MRELRIAMVGASGRMGAQVAAAANAANLAFTALDGDAPLDDAVVIDFSTPAGFDAALDAARAHARPLVSGTTGLTTAQFGALDDAAATIPVLWSANFSRGVNVLLHLVELAAAALPDFDAEVFEAHHRHKVDAPGGTAIALGDAVASARSQALADVATWTRHGATGPRPADAVGFQVVRGGSITGEHTVFLCGDGERVELTHRAQDRAIFARGAIDAARWLAEQPPGRYTMRDVLFR